MRDGRRVAGVVVVVVGLRAACFNGRRRRSTCGMGRMGGRRAARLVNMQDGRNGRQMCGAVSQRVEWVADTVGLQVSWFSSMGSVGGMDGVQRHRRSMGAGRGRWVWFAGLCADV